MKSRTPRSGEKARASVDRICGHLREGRSLRMACALERVERKGLEDLRARDPEIEAAIACARAEGELVLIDAGDDAAASGRSTAWLQFRLERQYPDDWVPPKQRVEQTGADGGPVKYEVQVDAVDKLSDEEAIAAAKALLGKVGE